MTAPTPSRSWRRWIILPPVRSNESIPITFTATDGDGVFDTVTLSFTVSDNEPPTVDIVSQVTTLTSGLMTGHA